MEPTEVRNDSRKRRRKEVAEAVCVRHEPTRCKMDAEHMLGIVGIVGTVLNLLVVVFVYVYTPV